MTKEDEAALFARVEEEQLAGMLCAAEAEAAIQAGFQPYMDAFREHGERCREIRKASGDPNTPVPDFPNIRQVRVFLEARDNEARFRKQADDLRSLLKGGGK